MSHYDEEEDWMRISQPESRKRVQNRLSQRRHRERLSLSMRIISTGYG